MNRKIIIFFIITGVFLGIGYALYQRNQTTKIPAESKSVVFDPKNCSYAIEGKNTSLKNGYAEQSIPDSSAKTITQYFGNDVSGDFNGDGLTDNALLLTQETGGSGTFYYVAAALNSSSGCQGTNAILLGDRIAPQTTEFRNDELIVNFADRNPGEPLTANPSFGVSKYFKVSDNGIIEIKK